MSNNKEKQNRIYELRKEKHLTLQQVADEIGVGNNTISRWENGIREPKLIMWRKLAKYFGVPVSYLMGLSDDRDGWKTVEQYTGLSKKDIESGKLNKRTIERMNDDILKLGSPSDISNYLYLLLAIDTNLTKKGSIPEDDKKLAHQLLDNLLDNHN